tara:strand:- start:3407 stop:4123 length:717 start_codon:yes stop_codon:yes gene_type:complete
MTWLEMKREIERQARMDLDSDVDLTSIEFWLNMALDEMDAYHPWWFLEDEYEVTLVADTRLYAFPTTNSAGAASVMTAIDVDSMRTLKKNIAHEWPVNIDHQNVNWTDSGETSAGPNIWTTVGKQIALGRPPTSDFVTNHEKLFFRGWKLFPTYAVADNSSEVAVPANYHPVVIQGALKHAWGERGVDQEAMIAERGFLRNLEIMVGRCLPVRGRTKNITAPTIWRLPRRNRSRRVSV